MAAGSAAHLLYALAWGSFGLAHSLLAREGAKRRLRPLLGRAYRLAYNLLAAAHIAAVLAVGRLLLGAAPPYVLPAWLDVLRLAALASGAVVLAAGLRGYDLGLFAGMRQLREGEQADAEPLHTGGLNAYVRHPLYAGGILLLWGLATAPLGLATALWGTLYLVIGARFEERALAARHGAAYAAYRARVPFLVPWKGRAL